MGAILIPVSKQQIENSDFNGDGKTIIQALYTYDKNSLTEILSKLKKFVFEESEIEFHYSSVSEGLATIIEIKDDIKKLSPNSVSNYPLIDLVEDLNLIENWLQKIGCENDFYLLIA